MGVSAFWKVAATSLILVFLNQPADAQSPKSQPPDVQNSLNQRLVDASSNGNIAEMKNLIAEGADANLQDRDGRTALHKVLLMCMDKKTALPVADLLLQHGADLTIKDRGGKTPLDSVSLSSCPEMQQLVRKYKR